MTYIWYCSLILDHPLFHTCNLTHWIFYHFIIGTLSFSPLLECNLETWPHSKAYHINMAALRVKFLVSTFQYKVADGSGCYGSLGSWPIAASSHWHTQHSLHGKHPWFVIRIISYQEDFIPLTISHFTLLIRIR